MVNACEGRAKGEMQIVRGPARANNSKTNCCADILQFRYHRLMRRAKSIVIFFLLVCSEFSGAEENVPLPPSPAANHVRVAFWNIQWFPGHHPNASPEEEQRQIRAVQRDIGSLAAD